MADLRGALLAAAEEADKMQKEINNRLDNLESYVRYVEGENERLKKKIQKAAEFAKQFADILSED
jgi:tetrahydromethanopterin S-methyltransferase subunit G